ncbi:MAG: hypothetical protein KJP18_06875 [Gemmatimonadetes bacterium]|nr:hypothetical protein [Gemmatimonadota bacterium]
MDGASPILVAGFGPFDHHAVNPAERIACSMDGHTIESGQVCALPLRTSWFGAWEAVARVAAEFRPQALLMIGVSDYPCFSLEQFARNRAAGYTDCDGQMPPVETEDRRLRAAGPDRLPGSFPFPEYVQALARSGAPAAPNVGGIPIRLSTDAGRFICNQVYYLALLELGGIVPRIGFVHVPPLGYGAPDTDRPDETPVVLAGVALVAELLRYTLTRPRDGAHGSYARSTIGRDSDDV